MDNTINTIKNYVLEIDSTVTDNTFLDHVINVTVDRALIFMNRDQFVDQFEEDLNNGVEDKYLTYPVPPRLYRPLASVVLEVYQDLENKKVSNDSELGNITKIKDHEQEITYSQVKNYFKSESDSNIFSSISDLLVTYRVGFVVSDNNYKTV